MALSNLPPTILAMSDLHKELRQRVVFRCWRSVTQHQQSAWTAKHLKKERRQKTMDECMEQAEAKSRRDGSHSLYKIIRQFRTCKPQERVQLRNEHGCFLSSSDEAGLLKSYSETFFGTGEDFPLTGTKGRLGISPAEVKEQISSIKVGKAVPRDSSATSSQISWLPKPARVHSEDTCRSSTRQAEPCRRGPNLTRRYTLSKVPLLAQPAGRTSRHFSLYVNM